MNTELKEESKQLSNDIEKESRFSQAEGGIQKKAGIYNRKTEALKELIQILKTRIDASASTEREQSARWQLEYVELEEKLLATEKLVKLYDEQLKDWQQWFEPKARECEENFDKV